MAIASIILIGLASGIAVRIISPGTNNISGFIFTSVIGILGAFIANYLGMRLGLYRVGETGELIAALLERYQHYSFLGGHSASEEQINLLRKCTKFEARACRPQ